MVEKIDLSTGWIFRDKNEAEWHPATVPGTIHTDLMDNGIIQDAFYGCNEKDVQWVGERDWIYKSQFTIDSSVLKRPNILLVFDGLDTYADVFLNGDMILQTNNMHRKWEVQCKNLIRIGNNLLEVHLQSASNKFIEDSLALGYPLPGGRWVFARKAAYHFGWDWGPKLITSGIHKPVYLEVWNAHRPTDFHIQTTEIDSNSATIELSYEIESAIAENATFKITDKNSRKELTNQPFALTAGKNNYEFNFAVHNPKIWWTNGLGEPHIYDLQIELTTESGYKHTKEIPFGIRTLRTVLEDDEIGKALYVELNGIPVYMKGANYIPQHSFMSEVTDSDYQRVVEIARESNMNMLRVWGGGTYEKDIFYELCNRNGILVWQDFMFACAMYPSNDDYIENVKQEAIQQVKRLRNHSNLALWCGNNEIDEGWHNWGWQRAHSISTKDSATIWESYKKVFHQLLPNVVKEYNPQSFYLSSSPLHGWGRKESMTHGDSHYWGVWWGVQPSEMYLEKVPRFMSEFGLQAMPSLATIREFQTVEEDYLFSPTLKCHQKHPTGFETIDAYLKMEGLYAETLDEFIYLSQLVQAKGIGLAIEAQRRAKPRCMGTLYWQLNDCWPVTSWSGSDFYGDWKALQYTVRNLFADIMVSAIDYKNRFEVYIVSDRLNKTKGKLELNIVDFSGNRTALFSEDVSIGANTSKQIISSYSNELFTGIDKETVLVEVLFTDNKGKHYVNQKFLVPYGKVKLPLVNISHRIEPATGGFNITLNSNALAAHVQLYLTNSHAWFSNNFFNLLPNKEITVYCKSDLSIAEFKAQLKITCLKQMITRRQE